MMARDPDGDPITFVLETPASDGTVSLNQDGTGTFQVPDDFLGDITFGYSLNDAIESSGESVVTIHILG